MAAKCAWWSRDEDGGRPGVSSMHVTELVSEALNLTSRGAIVIPDISEIRGSGYSSSSLPDQPSKLSTANAILHPPPATKQTRSNIIEQQAHVLHVFNRFKSSPNNTTTSKRIKSLHTKYPNLTETKTTQEKEYITNPLSPTPNFDWYDSIEQDNRNLHLNPVVSASYLKNPNPHPTRSHGQDRLPSSAPTHYLGRWVTPDTPPGKPRWPAKTIYQPSYLTKRTESKFITSSTTPPQA